MNGRAGIENCPIPIRLALNISLLARHALGTSTELSLKAGYVPCYTRRRDVARKQQTDAQV